MCTGNDKLNFREFRDMMNKKSRAPSKSEGSTYDQKIIPTRKHKNKAEKQLFQICSSSSHNSCQKGQLGPFTQYDLVRTEQNGTINALPRNTFKYKAI